ncbi:uncharacterized protein LOC127238013 [Phodopus roborovskii]|uniref:uncharacterized protein LOC127238013 n=1 Tax=Phodopus roborovskii TaxID=109678 RepID=UPI0021E48C3E|nr:uncharacterized protein LOC127238013 [Phodopus roborovskii]
MSALTIFWRKRMMLWLLIHLTHANEEYFWSFTRTWPIPVPVHNVSSTFPQFYSTLCHFGVPCKAKDKVNKEQQAFNQSRVPLQGTLCFSKDTNASPCVLVQRQVLSAFEDPLRSLTLDLEVKMLHEALSQIASGALSGSGTGTNGSPVINVTTYWMNMTFIAPKISRHNSYGSYNGSKPTHLCPNVFSEYPPEFLDCRGKYDKIVPISSGLWFTPDLMRYQYKNNSTKTGWPLSSWILINSKGAACDLSPLVNLEDSKVELYNVTGSLNTTNKKLTVSWAHKQHSISYPRGRVCVDPPFLFLLFNYSQDLVDCENQTCVISQCWGAEYYNSALVMRLPIFVPIPVKADPNNFPIATLFRQKRDFGITAAIVTAIAVSAAAAVTAGVAMANQVQTVQQVNEVIQKTSSALYVQEKVNTHLASGILMLNKSIDLLEGNIQDLFDIMTVSCVDRTPHICITPYPASINESRQLSRILSGNWSIEFEQLQANFTYHIQMLNDSKVELVTLGQFSDWMVKTFSYFKEWIGVGMFGMFCLAGMALVLFLICRMRFVRKREKVAIARALTALEAGQSPQAWISIFQDL